MARTKSRGNGQGSVYKLPSGKWQAAKTLGYWCDSSGKLHRNVRKRSFTTKKDAVKWLAAADDEIASARNVTFRALYDKWLPTHRASKSTIDCYQAAMNWMRPVWTMKMGDISVDDLQCCLDECPKGKRTKENMKAMTGLVYKFGIPRKMVPDGLNLAQYLSINAGSTTEKDALPEWAVDKLREVIGVVPFADYIYAQCYLGFRPSEFLALDAINYNRKERAFVGGGKTDAGTNRTVTVSPKIQSIIDRLVRDKLSGPVFCDADGSQLTIKQYRQAFYMALDAIGLDNPIITENGTSRHKFTPHSCRNTFATMMKRVQGADKDKLSLIGHTSTTMLRHYQDVDYFDLRKITDAI